MAGALKEDLINLKNRLENIELKLQGQVDDLEIREMKWKDLESRVEQIYKYQGDIIKINVGGKNFATRSETLLNIKDTLLYKMLTSDRFNLKDGIFFDRSPKYFPYLLEYIRNKKIDYNKFKKDEMKELLREAEYFEIIDIADYIEQLTRDIEFIAVEKSCDYVYQGKIAGTDKVQDLTDKSMTKGICANSPGWIIVELNHEWEFEEIDIGGFKGDSNLWYSGNGTGATIQTSKNKSEWKTVGNIPSDFGTSVRNIKLTRSFGRFIKFQCNSYVGIGYLKIKKIITI